MQREKKVVSDSPGLVDFATGLMNSVLNLPDGQVKFFGEFTVINPAHQKKFFGLYKVTLGLVDSSYSLPKWQAVKLTFFAPWVMLLVVGESPAPALYYSSSMLTYFHCVICDRSVKTVASLSQLLSWKMKQTSSTVYFVA